MITKKGAVHMNDNPIDRNIKHYLKKHDAVPPRVVQDRVKMTLNNLPRKHRFRKSVMTLSTWAGLLLACTLLAALFSSTVAHSLYHLPGMPSVFHALGNTGLQ